MYLHEIGKINIYLGLIKSHNWHIYILADEKASFTKEDLKEGKHIEYARSLLQEIVEKSGKSERCPSSPSSTEQKNASHSDYDWFDVGTSDKQRDGEIITDTDKHNDILSSSDSPKFEHTNPDALQQNSSFATDDDLGSLQGIINPCNENYILDFDPFLETQKGLAELLKMEAEVLERDRMVTSSPPPTHRYPPPPPPGFTYLPHLQQTHHLFQQQGLLYPPATGRLLFDQI